jgi:hypothetical protein
MARGEVTGRVCIEAYLVVIQEVCSLKGPGPTVARVPVTAAIAHPRQYSASELVSE